MENIPAAFRSKLWPCIVLGLLASALALTSLWLALAPPARELPSLRLAGTPAAVAECVAGKLRTAAPGNGTRDPMIHQPQVSILTRDNDPTARMIVDGTMQVHVVISLSQSGKHHTEARLTTVPIPDPAPGLSKIIQTCARR